MSKRSRSERDAGRRVVMLAAILWSRLDMAADVGRVVRKIDHGHEAARVI